MLTFRPLCRISINLLKSPMSVLVLLVSIPGVNVGLGSKLVSVSVSVSVSASVSVSVSGVRRVIRIKVRPRPGVFRNPQEAPPKRELSALFSLGGARFGVKFNYLLEAEKQSSRKGKD